MKRTYSHIFILAAVIGAIGLAPQAPLASGDKPNVLFIVCDDLNRHVSSSGYAPIQTPALERFAAASLTLGRSYCQYPVCKGKEVVYTVVSRGEQLGRSIRTQRWRYAEWGGPDLAELYDLQKDPHEYTNLVKDSDCSSQLKEMKALFQKARQHAAGNQKREVRNQ